jgi:hypothetical protein
MRGRVFATLYCFGHLQVAVGIHLATSTSAQHQVSSTLGQQNA